MGRPVRKCIAFIWEPLGRMSEPSAIAGELHCHFVLKITGVQSSVGLITLSGYSGQLPHG